MTPVEIAAVATAAVSLFWQLFNFLAARTVKNADEANKKRDDKIEELEEIKTAQQQQINDLKHTLTSLTEKISEVRGLLAEVKESNEHGRDKQADFYRDELKKMEINFRQELSKQSGNEAFMLVRKLEEKVNGLVAARRKK